MKLLRKHLSYSNVVATLALFVALGGGTALALKGKNTVDSGDIKPLNVRTSDIADGAVTSLKAAGLTGEDLTDSSITGADIGQGSLDGADIADGSLGSAEISDGSLGSADIADGSLNAGDHGADSLTGDQIDEALLTGAAVTGVDAATLGGFTGNDFAQGAIFTNRASTAPNSSVVVQSLSGYGRLEMDCNFLATASVTSTPRSPRCTSRCRPATEVPLARAWCPGTVPGSPAARERVQLSRSTSARTAYRHERFRST